MAGVIVSSKWKTPTLKDWLDANPHLKNHSSRLVVDPEVPISVNPSVVSSTTSSTTSTVSTD
jgi:hypothetical protein